ncbi:hypothetical protein VTL71DRAFT_8875 [Oculimacula yallundae]|uniref:Uncharacterized protein n=1 Tax=Oculimacula yallundae TaxID=86028 RepID=A0ABR4BT45_9HELO
MSSPPEREVEESYSTQDEMNAAESLMALSVDYDTAHKPIQLPIRGTKSSSSAVTGQESSSTTTNEANKLPSAERQALSDLQYHILSRPSPELTSDPEILHSIWLVRDAWEYEKTHQSRPSDMLLHLLRITWNCLHFRLRCESVEGVEKADRIHCHVEALQESLAMLLEENGEERCCDVVEMLDQVTEMVLSADCSGWLRRGEVSNRLGGTLAQWFIYDLARSIFPEKQAKKAERREWKLEARNGRA